MSASTLWPWAASIVGWLLAGGGVVLLAWSLFGDRSRGRRRCPRCWYDMRGAPGLRCPECGGEVAGEQALFRARRRWRWAVVGLVFGLVGPGLGIVRIARSGEWPRHTPTTALIMLLGRTSGYGVSWELTRRVERGDGVVGWVQHDSLWEWQWRVLRGRAAAMKGTSNSDLWVCHRLMEDETPGQGRSEPYALPLPTCQSPAELAASLEQADSPYRKLVIAAAGCATPDDYADAPLHAEVMAEGLPSADGAEAVVCVEGAMGTWTLLFLGHGDYQWVVRSRLVLAEWYLQSKPRIERLANRSFIVWNECVGHGTGIRDSDEVWFTVPDGREVLRFSSSGNSYSGSFTPVSYEWETTRANSSDSGSLDIITTVTFENDGMPRGAISVMPTIPWEQVGTLFTRRWRDRYRWDESAGRFLDGPSEPLDGWKPGSGFARLEIGRGEYEAESLLACNFELITTKARADPGLRQWAGAVADESDSPIARRMKRALAGLPSVEPSAEK